MKVKRVATSRIVPITAVTPSNLNNIIAGLGSGDKLEITQSGNGRAEITVKTPGQASKRMANRLAFTFEPEPVHNSWMGGAILDGDEKKSNRRQSDLSKAQRDSIILNNALKGMIEADLVGLTDEDFTLVKSSHGETQYMIAAGIGDVTCRKSNDRYYPLFAKTPKGMIYF